MNPKLIEQLIPFVEELATKCGEITRSMFRQPIEVEVKDDLSPVTLADKEIERTMRAMIQQKFPNHGIIGEEYEPKDPDANLVWLVDPIDGTGSFMIGRPIFGTLIALVEDDVPVMGIIDQPILGERWIGAVGMPTIFNNTQAKTRNKMRLEDTTLCTTSPNLFHGDARDKFESLRERVSHTIYGGDCYSYGLVANGTVDIVLESGLNPHDFCALAPIVNGAGGVMTDWAGEPITLKSDGNVIACGARHLHNDILGLLA